MPEQQDDTHLVIGLSGPGWDAQLSVAPPDLSTRRKVEFDSPGLSDRVDDVVFRCRLDPLESLAAEYARRIRDVKQA